MFKRSERLTRTSFNHYFKTGKRVGDSAIDLVYHPHSNLHVSVVVGKKVAAKAHDRNKTRRRIYSKLYHELKGAQTGVFILLVKPQFKNLTKQEQIAQVQKVLNRITMSTT